MDFPTPATFDASKGRGFGGSVAEYRWILLAVLLSINAGMLAYSATVHSPTQNEPAHLVAGLSHWEFGRFELYRVNPPLVRMIAAIPVLIAGYQRDWSGFYEVPGARPAFAMGGDFIHANGARSIWLFTIARWACIPISLLGCWFVFRFAEDLYGTASGLGAATLWCLSPTILAHAEWITPDCAAATFGIAATYFFWKWLKTPCWSNAGIAGLFLGLAELSKASWMILFVLWPLLWAFWLLTDKRSGEGKREPATPFQTRLVHQLSQLGLILTLALYLMNLTYGCEGSLSRLEDIEFVSATFTGLEEPGARGNRFEGALLGELPVPLPANYLRGVDIQKRDFENYRHPNYLRGNWKDDGGWWYYYLYALAVKIALGTWMLFLVSLAARAVRIDPLNRWREEVILLSPALVLLVVASSQTEINAHLRYVLPAIGTALIFSSRALLLPTCQSLSPAAKRCATGLVTICRTWTVAATLWNYPNQMAYFNELAGGPYNGHKHLLGSNLDWGQSVPIQGGSRVTKGVFIYAPYNVRAIDSSLIGVSEKTMRDLHASGTLPEAIDELHVGYSAIHQLFPQGHFTDRLAARGIHVEMFPDKFVLRRQIEPAAD